MEVYIYIYIYIHFVLFHICINTHIYIDLYTALYGSGQLSALLSAGVRYMFVSNSDNLGATLDLDLLAWFAAVEQADMPFVMECCQVFIYIYIYIYIYYIHTC